MWGKEPKDGVDAYGRPCLHVQSDDNLIAVEWLKPPPPDPSKSNSPVTWGGRSVADPDPRDRHLRNARGALELKKLWT